MSVRVRCFPPGGAPLDLVVAGPVVLGRDGGCDLPLDDGEASSRHCRLTPGPGGRLVIEDLGSTNGTRLNGKPVMRGTLGTGDVLEIGHHRIACWDGSRPPAPPAAAGAHPWRLVPRDGAEGVPIGPGLVVGRAADCDLILDHATISTRHARLQLEGDTLVCEDLDSSNGTWVDGARTRRSRLRHGQLVAFGQVAFLVQEGDRPLAVLRSRAARRGAALGVCAVVAVLGGLLAIRLMGPVVVPSGIPHERAEPNPARGPTGPAPVVAGPLRLVPGAGGVFALDRDGIRLVAAGALVLLDATGAVVAQQEQAVARPAADGAAGTLAGPGGSAVPFAVRPFRTADGRLAVAATLGPAPAGTLAGLRLDLAPGVPLAWVDGPAGRTAAGEARLAVDAVEEIALGTDPPLVLRCAAARGLRAHPAPEGWRLLFYADATVAADLSIEARRRGAREDTALSVLRSRADAAAGRREWDAARTAYRELLAALGDDDPESASVRAALRDADAGAR